MVPQRDDERTRILLSDLCAYLSQSSPVQVVPHRSPSSEALASALHAGRVQVAWVGALLMLVNEQMVETVPIVSSVRENVALYHSVLFAPAQSSIRDIQGTKGKRIAWVAPSSSAGYVVPRLSLIRAGVPMRGWFAEERFTGSHVNAVRAVVEGAADVAATYAIFEGGDARRELARSGYRTYDPKLEVRVLDTSGPIPADLIVAAPTVSPEIRRVLSSALLRISGDPRSKAIMSELIGADGFTPFTPAVLREVRTLIAAARESGAVV
jgi:phosphate/phosphite/phosphonate ABC transporter binding protein